MSVKEQEDNLKGILGAWPNTYTFTKSMGERTLRKRRNPNLPTVIIRPSIIVGAMKEPALGWTDTISAAGGLSLIGGMGVINFIHGKTSNIADLIPVDIVSNLIIVSTAQQAKKPELKVIHCSSSNRRPITWGEYKIYVFDYLKNNPYNIQAFPPSIEFINND